MVARQTYPLDGGNAALAPALRVQFEIPDGVVVPQAPEVRENVWGQSVEHNSADSIPCPLFWLARLGQEEVAACFGRKSLYAHMLCL